MLMKSIPIIACLFLNFSNLAFCQEQNVVLSSLKVMDVMDPATGEASALFIELTVSTPASLAKLEIIMQDKNGLTDPPLVIKASVIDNISHLEIQSQPVAFEGNKIRFTVPVRDQVKASYHTIAIKGTGIDGRETNQVIFKK
jgi:hypothetical protein